MDSLGQCGASVGPALQLQSFSSLASFLDEANRTLAEEQQYCDSLSVLLQEGGAAGQQLETSAMQLRVEVAQLQQRCQQLTPTNTGLQDSVVTGRNKAEESREQLCQQEQQLQQYKTRLEKNKQQQHLKICQTKSKYPARCSAVAAELRQLQQRKQQMLQQRTDAQRLLQGTRAAGELELQQRLVQLAETVTSNTRITATIATIGQNIREQKELLSLHQRNHGSSSAAATRTDAADGGPSYASITRTSRYFVSEANTNRAKKLRVSFKLNDSVIDDNGGQTSASDQYIDDDSDALNVEIQNLDITEDVEVLHRHTGGSNSSSSNCNAPAADSSASDMEYHPNADQSVLVVNNIGTIASSSSSLVTDGTTDSLLQRTGGAVLPSMPSSMDGVVESIGATDSSSSRHGAAYEVGRGGVGGRSLQANVPVTVGGTIVGAAAVGGNSVGAAAVGGNSVGAAAAATNTKPDTLRPRPTRSLARLTLPALQFRLSSNSSAAAATAAAAGQRCQKSAGGQLLLSRYLRAQQLRATTTTTATSVTTTTQFQTLVATAHAPHTNANSSGETSRSCIEFSTGSAGILPQGSAAQQKSTSFVETSSSSLNENSNVAAPRVNEKFPSPAQIKQLDRSFGGLRLAGLLSQRLPVVSKSLQISPRNTEAKKKPCITKEQTAKESPVRDTTEQVSVTISKSGTPSLVTSAGDAPVIASDAVAKKAELSAKRSLVAEPHEQQTVPLPITEERSYNLNENVGTKDTSADGKYFGDAQQKISSSIKETATQSESIDSSHIENDTACTTDLVADDEDSVMTDVTGVNEITNTSTSAAAVAQTTTTQANNIAGEDDDMVSDDELIDVTEQTWTDAASLEKSYQRYLQQQQSQQHPTTQQPQAESTIAANVGADENETSSSVPAKRRKMEETASAGAAPATTIPANAAQGGTPTIKKGTFSFKRVSTELASAASSSEKSNASAADVNNNSVIDSASSSINNTNACSSSNTASSAATSGFVDTHETIPHSSERNGSTAMVNRNSAPPPSAIRHSAFNMSTPPAGTEAQLVSASNSSTPIRSMFSSGGTDRTPHSRPNVPLSPIVHYSTAVSHLGSLPSPSSSPLLRPPHSPRPRVCASPQPPCNNRLPRPRANHGRASPARNGGASPARNGRASPARNGRSSPSVDLYRSANGRSSPSVDLYRKANGRSSPAVDLHRTANGRSSPAVDLYRPTTARSLPAADQATNSSVTASIGSFLSRNFSPCPSPRASPAPAREQQPAELGMFGSMFDFGAMDASSDGLADAGGATSTGLPATTSSSAQPPTAFSLFGSPNAGGGQGSCSSPVAQFSLFVGAGNCSQDESSQDTSGLFSFGAPAISSSAPSSFFNIFSGDQASPDPAGAAVSSNSAFTLF